MIVVSKSGFRKAAPLSGPSFGSWARVGYSRNQTKPNQTGHITNLEGFVSCFPDFINCQTPMCAKLERKSNVFEQS